jgi:hypothetical protein
LTPLGNHYTALRRFLPQWYEIIPLVATTSEDSLLKAIRFLRDNALPDISMLPVTGAPVQFLDPQWKRRALFKHQWDKRILSVQKAPYELGIVEATARSLEDGTVGIENASRYAPMTQHLLPYQEFIANYSKHLNRLDRPEKAVEYYEPLRSELSESLSNFDREYKQLDKKIRVNQS